ncbi:MAG: DegT/DnrJ/EryC1/StrS family aminotransferase [Dehalococcoidia bacterium]|nr:DegT/DnrJ/EryC1/StrS family aminotransferase [Dehalococcoidia bacterium]
MFIISRRGSPCAARHDLQEALKAAGIGTLIHYPAPIHLPPTLSAPGRGRCVACQRTDRAEIFSLPLYPEMTDADE